MKIPDEAGQPKETRTGSATDCNRLQQIATDCNRLQHTHMKIPDEAGQPKETRTESDSFGYMQKPYEKSRSVCCSVLQ